MTRKHQLADLQLAIMQVLWNQGECTVADVRSALEPARKLAHTTVGTMLARMEEAGQVTRKEVGRANVYRAKVKQSQVNRTMVSDLKNRLFGGDATKMICQLLDGETVGAEELKRLKQLIRDKEREQRNE